MGDFNQPGPRRTSPGRVAISAAAYLAFLGISAWSSFAHGHIAGGIAFLAIFAGIPAAASLVVRTRRRRGITPKPRTPAQRRSTGVLIVLAGFVLIGALAIINAKPGDRLAAGIIVGVVALILGVLFLPTEFLKWYSSRQRR